MADTTRPTADEVLAKLPPLPQIARPFLRDWDQHGPIDSDDLTFLTEVVTGRSMDPILTEILGGIGGESSAVSARLQPPRLILQARPSNTINAFTVPTKEGSLVVFNIGLWSLLYSVALEVGRIVGDQSAESREQAVSRLAVLVDWATSRAREPRVSSLPATPDENGLASNLSGQAQRLALCHELAHALEEPASVDSTRTATVQGVVVQGAARAWEREFAADQAGADMFLQVLEARKRSPAALLIGAEVWFNTAAMLEDSDPDPDGGSHPSADERLVRLRHHFLGVFGDRVIEYFEPASAVRAGLEYFRSAVTPRVVDQRRQTQAAIVARLDERERQTEQLSDAELRTSARDMSRLLLISPGATMDVLSDELRKAAEQPPPPGSGREARALLAYNAALHFEPVLRAAIGLKS